MNHRYDYQTSLPRQETIICLMIQGVQLMTNASDIVATALVTDSSTLNYKKIKTTKKKKN